MFHVGQKVVFIGYDIPDALDRPVVAKVGNIYTVKSIFLYNNKEAIHLEELNTPYGWMAYGFRPVTNISVFQKLLITKKIDELV